MTTREAPNLFRHVWKSVLAWGVLTSILGVLVLVWPGKSILVAAVLFGIYLVGSGIAQLIFAFTLDVSGGERVLLFISSALSIVLGVLPFRHFEEGWPILLLAAWIGVAFIFRGLRRRRWPSASAAARAGLAHLLGRAEHHRGHGGDRVAVQFDRDVGDCHRRVACHHRDRTDRLGIAGAQRDQFGRACFRADD
jgi:hypothetical protein